ncbi:putative CUB domain-containing protein-like 6 [Homarus americanus]|uniref:Putative CUB domain-containing protein-like 6 n=2 Tax=Homarus americanus TaxID=6706 RepID=A0A8J5KJZ8_HOMAM|nr:putative CUB domain-containing protein-like 6 [Homarus americanus]
MMMKYMLTLLVVTVTVVGAIDNKTAPVDPVILPCVSHTMNLGDVVLVQSPGYPARLTNKSSCQQNIVCQSPSAKLGVACEVFNLEDCDNERLIISYDTTSSTLCGNVKPNGVFPTNAMKLEFITKGVNDSTGYNCSITCLR